MQIYRKKTQATTSWIIIGKDEVGSSNLPSSSRKTPQAHRACGVFLLLPADSNGYRTRRWRLHRPVRKPADSLILFSRPPQGKTQCKRILPGSVLLLILQKTERIPKQSISTKGCVLIYGSHSSPKQMCWRNDSGLTTAELFFAELFEDRNIGHSGLPNDVTAHAAVAMSNKVPHALDRAPLNAIGRGLSKLL